MKALQCPEHSRWLQTWKCGPMVSLLCPVYIWLNSEPKTAASWWQQDILPSALFKYLSDHWEKRSTRKGPASSAHGGLLPVSTDHSWERTRQTCLNNHACRPAFLLLSFWKKFYVSLVYYWVQEPPQDKVWYHLQFSTLHEHFRPTEFRLAVRKCGMRCVTSR